MRTEARSWLYAVTTVAVGAIAFALISEASGGGLGQLSVLLPFVALQALNWWAAGWLGRRFRIAVWQLDGAFLAAAALLLPPAGVVVALTAGALLGLLVDGTKPLVASLNLGQSAISACAATGVLLVLVQDERLASWQHAVGVVLVVLAWGVSNELAISLYHAICRGQEFVSELRSGLAFSLPRAPFVASLGYVAGLAGTVSPIAPLLAVPPMAAMVYVLAEHFRAERDRERAETLFRTAEAAHASIEPHEVAAAVTTAASSLLKAESAELLDRAPTDEELGVRLDVGEDQWLVVRGATPGADDDQLLSAVAAVGSSALENARMAEELRHRAVHDDLTDLPNQVLFADRVAQAISAGGRSHERFAVMALNLDAFRKVNDSLGHRVGDELLRVVADRLTAAVSPGDTVARLSSDVFMLLLPGVGSAETAGVITEKLLAAVRRPIPLAGQDVFMTACAGLAFYPDDGRLADHLLRNADSALHRAKGNGPGSYQIYASGMNELAHQRLAREGELHQAVRRDELRIRYQPQIDLRTGRLVGVEALVRWEHPTLGLLGPTEFVPLAEESGLIVDVDTWVLRHAAQQAATWMTEGLAPVRVAVNLSARHFQFPERLLGTIRDVIAESGLPAALLELEVTEGLAVGEDESAEILQRVRDLGVSISIDDFGTGYSMLGRLHRFPVDRLKIDRTFVCEITSARTDAPIVSAIIAMARSLKMETVAEGVETLEQQTFLRNRGCDLAQGFLFSHPAEADEVARMLRTGSVGFNVSAFT